MTRVRETRSEAAQQQPGVVSLASSDSGGRDRGNGSGERPEPKRDERTLKALPTRVYIAVNGCHENHMDAALVQRYLGSTGRFVAAANVGDADVVIVQGCAVTQHMENESRDIIAHLEQAKRPDAKLIVAGCIARFRPELATGDAGTSVPLDAIGHIMYDLDENARRLAVNHLESAPEDLQAYLGERKEQVFAGYTATGEPTPATQRDFKPFHLAFKAVRSYKDFVESRLDVCAGRTYSIKACTGCLGQCAYCSVRQTRGTVRSKTMDEVMTEFRRGLDSGYTDIALLGTDIGDYGKDIGLDFIDLLRKMVDVPRPFNLRLRNVNPRWIAARWQDFCEVAETGKITYMQVALQSGSDRVLALMRRGHQIGELMDALAEIRGRAPRLVLRTQLIAGFPTESDWDFRQSMAVVKSGVFDYTDVFRYTSRPGTAAAEIEPEVPWDVIMRRYRALFFETTVRHPVRTMSAVRRMRSAPLQS